MGLKYLHTMVRVIDIDASPDFYCNKLGLEEVTRVDVEAGRFTLVFLSAPATRTRRSSSRTTGTPRRTAAAETSDTWRTRWTTSTPPVSAS